MGRIMKRIFLFILINLAVVFAINITLRLLGVDRMPDQSGASLAGREKMIAALVS